MHWRTEETRVREPKQSHGRRRTFDATKRLDAFVPPVHQLSRRRVSSVEVPEILAGPLPISGLVPFGGRVKRQRYVRRHRATSPEEAPSPQK
jgi:hypothetical protein